MVVTAPLREPRAIVLLGTPFHDVTMEETLERIDAMVAGRAPRFIVTANLDFATQAARDVELQRILVEAELVVCDGTPLVWASRLTGKPLRERVAGSDLVPRLLERAVEKDWSVFLLGGEPSSLESAAENIRKRHPGIRLTGYSPPFATFHEMDHAELIRKIRESRADILLVAFGCPKQEKWIYAHYRDAGVPCSIGVGATIDFLAGKVQRAPRWIGVLGLEWIFRLFQEPKRLFGRYARDLWFLFQQMRRERTAIFQPPKLDSADAAQKTAVDEEFETLFWQGQLVAATVDKLTPPSYRKPFIIDLSRVSLIDSSGLGHLLRTLRRGWSVNQVGCFAAVSQAVDGVLKVTRLDRVVPVAADHAVARSLLIREKGTSFLRPIIDAAESSMLVMMPQKIVSANAEECAAAIKREWESRPGIKHLRLDLGPTAFMDSSGLGFLIRCRRMTDAREGGTLRLLNVKNNVRNVIQVARLEPLLGMQ